jgi:hypothetical protein
MRNLNQLSRKVCVYPDPGQAISRGTKLYTLNAIREIGKSVTHTDYPEVVIIDDPLKGGHLKNKNLVIKRSFSDANHHVWLGSHQQDQAAIRKVIKNTRDTYNHQVLRDLAVVPTWFGVPYIPQLIKKGEIRCYFIGGALTYIISTEPAGDSLLIKEVQELTPLSYLS